MACGRALANGDYSLRSKPTNPIDAEFRVELSDDPLQYHDWPWLIRCSRETLLEFRFALEDAKAALDSAIEILPSADPAEQWKAKCSRLLIRLADSVQCTGKLDNDVRAFVTSGRLPAEWSKWLDELSELDGTWASVQLAGVPVEASEQELKERQEGGAEPAALAMFASLLDNGAIKAMAIAQDSTKSVEEKLQLLAAMDQRFKGKNSPELAKLLDVEPQAIRKTTWWKTDRHSETVV